MHPNYRGSPFSRHVDVLIESCKVGIRKPDTRIYQMACDRLNVDPNEVRTVTTSDSGHAFRVRDTVQ